MDLRLTKHGLTIVAVLAGAAFVASAPVFGAAIVTYEVRPLGHKLLNHVRTLHFYGDTHQPSVDR